MLGERLDKLKMFPNLQNPYFYLSNVTKPPNIKLPSNLNPPELGSSPFPFNFPLRNPLFFQQPQQVVPPFWNLHKYNQLVAQQRKEAMLRSLYYDVTQRYLQHNSFVPRMKKFSPVQLTPVMGRPRLPCKVMGEVFQKRGISESSLTSSSDSLKAEREKTSDWLRGLSMSHWLIGRVMRPRRQIWAETFF